MRAGFRLDEPREFLRELDGLALGTITSIYLVPAERQPAIDPVASWAFKMELNSRTG